MSDHILDPYIRRSIVHLAQTLQQLGVECVSINYTGSGDSADGCTLEEVLPPELQEQVEQHMLAYEHHSAHLQWDPAIKTYGPAKVNSVSTDGTLIDAIYELAGQLWSRAGEDGWYNNDGGGGSLTVYANGTYEFEHYNNVTTQETAVHWRSNILLDPVNAPIDTDEP